MQSDLKNKEVLMAKKRYKQDKSTSKVNEPELAYQTTPEHLLNYSQKTALTVDEYFDKVKQALDQRYEDLQRQNS